MEVRASRRDRTNKQQRRAGTATSGAMAKEVVRDKKREREPVCREDTDSDDEFAPARARCLGVSDAVMWRSVLEPITTFIEIFFTHLNGYFKPLPSLITFHCYQYYSMAGSGSLSWHSSEPSFALI